MESTSLDAMLEAVEKYMGEQFTDMLATAIDGKARATFLDGYEAALAITR